MDLQDFLTENTNVVECYICPTPCCKGEVIATGWQTLPPFPFKQLHTRTDYNIVEYIHRNMTYQYDLATDMQKALQLTWEKDTTHKHYYILSLHEDVLPNHRFPSTEEITHQRHIHRASFKWNNRIFLNVDKEDHLYTCSIRYNHSPNADMEKMNEAWQQLLHLLQGNPVVKSRV